MRADERADSTYNSPSSLNTELDAERTRREGAEATRKDPQRNEGADEADKDTTKDQAVS